MKPARAPFRGCYPALFTPETVGSRATSQSWWIVANWAGMQKTQAEAFRPPSADDPVLVEIARRLAEVYHPIRIYLFGSAARGDAGPDSDYDIMIVVPDNAPRERQDSDIGYQALWGVGLAKDILVWTKAEFEKRLHLEASLPSTIIREGKILYAA